MKNKYLALQLNLGLTNEESENINYLQDNTFEFKNKKYLVLTNEEKDDEIDNKIDIMYKNLVLPEIPENLHSYINYSQWFGDTKRQININSLFESQEYFEIVNKTYYYIYKIN